MNQHTGPLNHAADLSGSAQSVYRPSQPTRKMWWALILITLKLSCHSGNHWSSIFHENLFIHNSKLNSCISCLLCESGVCLPNFGPLNSVPESASKLYRASDRRLSAKLVPTFADRGCYVVSVTDPYSRILGFYTGATTFLPCSSSILLTRLGEPRSRPTTSQKIW
jgi:hypothetical protein